MENEWVAAIILTGVLSFITAVSVLVGLAKKRINFLKKKLDELHERLSKL
jgi:hypothetical protein